MGTVMGANILAAADSLRQAFDQTLGMHAAFMDGVLTVHVSVATLTGDWTLVWNAGYDDLCWDHGLTHAADGYHYWDPETTRRPLTDKEVLTMLNAPFDRGDTGRGLEAHGIYNGIGYQTAGMLRLALALDDAARLPGPGVSVALPFRLVWDS